ASAGDGHGARAGARSIGRAGCARPGRGRQRHRRANPLARQRPRRMIRLLRDFRLIPVVLAATIGLFTLKVLGLAFDGGYLLNGFGADDAQSARERAIMTPASDNTGMPSSRSSWATQRCGLPDVTVAVAAKKEGEPEAEKNAKAEPAKKAIDPKPGPNGTPIPLINNGERPLSPAERAILERLQERRQELDTRMRE